MAKAATPWGPAELLEELTLTQRAGDKRFSSMVQLLEAPGGERLVRFAYATTGTARRGPVTLRTRDLERLRAGLALTRLAHPFNFSLPGSRDGKQERISGHLQPRFGRWFCSSPLA